METLAVSIPRKQRKTVKGHCERIESALEAIDSDFVGRLTTCEDAVLLRLSEKLSAMQTLRSGEVDIGSVKLVEAALQELATCGDQVAGASRQLASREADVRRRGLEALRALPRVVLEESVSAEVTAARRRARAAHGRP